MALAIGLATLVFLLLRFGPYIENKSFDLVQHYLLVDEIMKHGTVRPDQYARIGAMAVYPPAAHWLAAIIGWIIGSGVVAITLVSVASMYACYVLAMLLLERTAAIVLFGTALLALRFTKSLLGYEIVVNFFYPQLVADVIYLGTLLWAIRTKLAWQRSVGFLVAGAAAMWVQPLVAVHILAAGCVMAAFSTLTDRRQVGTLVVTTIASAIIVLIHPALRVMRTISANDGFLVFWYSHVMIIAMLCGLVGIVNARRSRDNAIDVALGSAAVGGLLLVLLQFAAFKLQLGGSPYAVKKHMFLVLTFGIMNAIRLATRPWPSRKWSGVAAVLAAGVCAYRALTVFDFPVAPIVTAMSRAEHAANYQIPDYRADDIAFYDPSLPLMASVMISLTAFQHPFDAVAIGWQTGKNMLEGSSRVMVARTPDALAKCPARQAESREYIVVAPACLK